MTLQLAALGSRIVFSIEVFPAKTVAAEQRLWACVERLSALRPRFVSVTYGAGGSSRAQTVETVARIRRDTGLQPAAHLTCVGGSRSEVDQVARQYLADGVRHIVALRGDPPAGVPRHPPRPDEYPHAADLVAGLKRVADFEISVAAFPETHPEAPSAAADLDNLKRKVDAGASRAITQYFFAADPFLRFLERARAAGITIPIVPGILPIVNVAQLIRFSATCGTSLPAWLASLLDGLDDDPECRQMIAAATAIQLCQQLRDYGISEFHFYTLNRPELTFAICRALGLKAGPGPAAAIDYVPSAGAA